jgi:hypothetical protein
MFGLSNQEIYESRVDERLFETYNYGLFKKTISREQEKTRRYFDQVFRG